MLFYKILVNRPITCLTYVVVRLMNSQSKSVLGGEGIPDIITVSLVTNGEEEIIYEENFHEDDPYDIPQIIKGLVNVIADAKPNRRIFKETFTRELNFVFDKMEESIFF